MVLTAKLHIEGHEMYQDGIGLLSCSYSFTQDIDLKGRPSSDVKGGTVAMSFYSINDSEIMQWMINPYTGKNGKIEFSAEEDGKAFKTLEFKDAFCISYKEAFVRDGQLLTEIVISSRTLAVSDTTHSNHWSGYDPE